LVQVIDCPLETVIVAGTKANSAMLTAMVWPCGATAAGACACGADFGHPDIHIHGTGRPRRIHSKMLMIGQPHEPCTD
jgi:hypothetical protein